MNQQLSSFHTQNTTKRLGRPVKLGKNQRITFEMKTKKQERAIVENKNIMGFIQNVSDLGRFQIITITDPKQKSNTDEIINNKFSSMKKKLRVIQFYRIIFPLERIVEIVKITRLFRQKVFLRQRVQLTYQKIYFRPLNQHYYKYKYLSLDNDYPIQYSILDQDNDKYSGVISKLNLVLPFLEQNLQIGIGQQLFPIYKEGREFDLCDQKILDNMVHQIYSNQDEKFNEIFNYCIFYDRFKGVYLQERQKWNDILQEIQIRQENVNDIDLNLDLSYDSTPKKKIKLEVQQDKKYNQYEQNQSNKEEVFIDNNDEENNFNMFQNQQDFIHFNIQQSNFKNDEIYFMNNNQTEITNSEQQNRYQILEELKNDPIRYDQKEQKEFERKIVKYIATLILSLFSSQDESRIWLND